ncbi:MAG: glycosyltransferase [Fusobacterium perfoetens]|uniref:glycosyltransferase n=1 Tax=Fusobacterium perfoetens TaxID=852 RepID=UPI0023F3EF57|nr:glycosyltransferase [Fusobacterium perfoetens]MCI6152861.1 glycosyltransferase [Fusobacterium perfoetens]MDY3237273.1 glycosyltransferase [Fusobacterium perfoetens]
MKKIIFCTDSLIMGGQEKISIDYLKLLSEINEFEIFLLLNEDNGADNYFIKDIPKGIKYEFVIDKNIIEKINLYRKLKSKNIIYKLFYNYYLKRRRFNYRKNIKKILENQKYDYILDFSSQLPYWVCNEKVYSWSHLSLSKIKMRKLREARKKVNSIGKLVVLTDDMLREAKKIFFKEKQEKFVRIYNFFDIEEIQKLSLDKSQLNNQEKSLIEEDYFFACCRIDKQKDIDTLIESYKILKEKYKIKEKLYIAGIGDQKERLENLLKNYNLEKDIIFLGIQKNPYVWMKNSKFFIHSSHYEGFGLVLVEALISNGLVVASDCPTGPREILENGKSGILFPVGDKEKIVEIVLKVLENKELVESYKKEAKRRIEDFSKDKIKKEIKKLLK